MVDQKASNNKNGSIPEAEALIDELKTVKQLLVILLAKLGSDSGEIGKALGVDPRRIREWISFNGIERVVERASKRQKRGSENNVSEVESATEEMSE